MWFNHYHGHQTTECSLVTTEYLFCIFIFYHCMHFQHAFKWTNSGWTLCVMLCCVCWQLAHHNHHVSLLWLGILLKCCHTWSVRSCELCCCYWLYCWRPPPPQPPPATTRLHTRTLESLICDVPCLLFIMLLCFPCITAAGGVPKGGITTPSSTVFLSRYATNISVPGRFIMVVRSNHWLEERHVTEMSQVGYWISIS